jgi:hypothetical protein
MHGPANTFPAYGKPQAEAGADRRALVAISGVVASICASLTKAFHANNRARENWRVRGMSTPEKPAWSRIYVVCQPVTRARFPGALGENRLVTVLHGAPCRRISAGRMSDQIVGEVWSYEDLHRIMRERANELKLSRESIDAIAGLQPGYAAKLLSPRPIEKLGALSKSLVLPVLGIKVVVMVDEQKARDLQGRINGSTMRESHMRSQAVHKIVHTHRRLRQWGRKGGTNSRAKMSRKRASELGRLAALARWGKRTKAVSASAA